MKTYIIPFIKETAKDETTFSSRHNILLLLVVVRTRSRSTVEPMSKPFFCARITGCSERVENFIEWAAALPVGPNTHSIWFQPSAAVDSSLLRSEMEKQTVDRLASDKMVAT